MQKRQDKTNRQTDKAARTTPENKKNTHANADGKKNTRRGGNLGEGEQPGVQIEVVVLGHDEETQGERQTLEKWFGVPQRRREGERERNVAGETDQTTR